MTPLRVRAAALVAAAAVAALPAVAWAHAHVVSTRPGSGATLSAPPARVTVTYDDPVTLVPHALAVTTDAGSAVATAAPQVSDDGRVLSARLTGDLAAGDYHVSWRIRSDDGHIETGEFAFAVAAHGDSAGGAVSGHDHSPPPAEPVASAQPEPDQPVWPVATAAALAALAGVGAGLAVHRGLRAARDGSDDR